MSVVTLYCCGSGGNRDKHGKWAVPYFKTITRGRCFIVDGVGGAPIPKVEDIYSRLDKGKHVKLKQFNTRRKKNKLHEMNGWGTQDNILLCMDWLWRQYYKRPFHVINMCGWSRGSITCILLAHTIQESGLAGMGNIDVNIFGFDPVKGSNNDFGPKGTFEATGRVGVPEDLSICVRNYAAIC